MPRVLLQLLRPSRRPRLARILSSSQPEGHCTSVGDATMLGVSTYRPIGVLAMGLICVLGCAFVLFFWVGPDGLPALLYAWRLAPSTTSEATVVNTEISRGSRGPDVWYVTLERRNRKVTSEVWHRSTFSELKPGQPVTIHLVMDKIVEIDTGGQAIPVDDKLGWLVGLPGWLILGCLFVRAGFHMVWGAGGWRALFEQRTPDVGVTDLPGRVSLALGITLGVSGGVLGLWGWVSNGTPPWPVAVITLAACTTPWVKARSWFTRQPLDIGQDLLVTAVITPDHDGSVSVSFIGDTRKPTDTTLAALTEASLEHLDHLIARSNRSRPLGVQYAWYPWPDNAKRVKGGDLLNDYLIFDVQRNRTGYKAFLAARHDLHVSAPTFAELAPALESYMANRLGIERQPLRGCITWNRILTHQGFTPYHRKDGPQPSPSS